jgi:hypothetical protein
MPSPHFPDVGLPSKSSRQLKGEGKTQADMQEEAFKRALSQMLGSRSTLGANALEIRDAEAEQTLRVACHNHCSDSPYQAHGHR